jgi:tRNA-specific 2-thiouridylase
MPDKRVLVAMSGGVDSSVTAALLVEQGYDVLGVTMKLFCYGHELPSRPCCSVESIRDAAAVAAQLGVPHYVLDLSESFERDVIRHFVSEYERGHTPIPCVRCNSHTKFKDLLDYADDLGCGYIATGHYAIAKDGALYRGKDHEKEQTYFLWGIDKSVLYRLILPVGRYSKEETRELARQLGFDNADKQESVEICFVPGDNYMAVLKQHLATDSAALSAGPIVTTTGEVVGEHMGYARYTVGQRRGLPGGFPEAMYVTRIVPEDRTVVIGRESDLLGRRLRLGGMHWLTPALAPGDRCTICTRYRSRLVDAVVTDSSNAEGGEVSLELADAVRAITPGQSGVLYDDDSRVLGGGVIK